MRWIAMVALAGCHGSPSMAIETDGSTDAAAEVDAPPSSFAECAGLTDDAIHAPPTSGAFAYEDFTPAKPGFPARGDSYVDPIFGCTVRRLSDVRPGWGSDLIYSKNGFWNADGTRYAHSPNNHGQVDIVDGTTGALVRENVPFGAEGSFDPVDPDVFYAIGYQSRDLHKLNVATGENVVLKTLPAPLDTVGGSVDWIDRSGRYFLLNYGGALHVWDKQLDVIYGGAIASTFGSGWAGLSPDGKYVIIGGQGGQDFQHWSFPIDHAGKTIGSGILFWSLCGPHSDVVSASDGKTYLIGFNCYDQPEIYRVDVSIPQTTTNIAKQKSDNVLLFKNDWKDSGHFSCASRGDWCFGEVASGDDTFTDRGVWRPFKQEIVAIQVVPPFAVHRIAHHRSRSPFSSYERQPRVNASWDGSKVAYASDYGDPGNGPAYADIYYVAFKM